MATGKSYNSVDSKEQLILIQTGEEEFGGYKQDLLVNTLNEVEIEFYVCTQCKGVMRNACQLGEEQIPVCETCVEEKVESQPMMKTRKKIPELKVTCPLATRGCKWNATLDEFDKHLDVCQEFLIECKYDCGVIIKRCELNNHCNNECLNRKVSCEHCQSMIVYKELNQHFKECPEFPLLCPNNCATSLKRKQIDSHIETDCPNTVVECRYERFGCKQVVKRCEMEEHKKTNETKHLEMTTFFAVDKIEKLEGTVSQLEEDLEKCAVTKVANLEKTFEDLSERERANTKEHSQMLSIIEKQSATIESLSYPVVLRDTIKERDLKESRGIFSMFIPIDSYDIAWRFINLRLIFGSQYKGNIPISIIMVYNKVMSPLAQWPFEGRFKLTIIDRVNRNNSLVYESAVVKLQPEQEPEQGFTLKEKYPSEFKIATLPRNLLLEEKFLTENRYIQFTLQIQEAEHVLLSMDTQSMKKELP